MTWPRGTLLVCIEDLSLEASALGVPYPKEGEYVTCAEHSRHAFARSGYGVRLMEYPVACWYDEAAFRRAESDHCEREQLRALQPIEAGKAMLASSILGLLLLAFVASHLHASDQVEPSTRGHWTTAEVTAYCPCALCCGASADGLTANLTSVRRVPYAFAADRSLPFGTRLFIPPGLGVLDQVRASDRWFTVDDRGGALDTEAARYGVLRLDLRVRDHWWAVRFGRRVLPVFITTNH